jgi:Amidohydrolase family
LLASMSDGPSPCGRTPQGKYVVPGGIDAHVHFNVALSPVMRAQSATFGGRAAAFGGTTTFIDFALQKNELSLISAIEDKQDELKKDKPGFDPERTIRMLIVGYCRGSRSARRLCEELISIRRIAGSAGSVWTARVPITRRFQRTAMSAFARAI